MARPRRHMEHMTWWFVISHIQVNRSAAVKHFNACKNFHILFHRFLGFPFTLSFVTDTPVLPALRLVLNRIIYRVLLCSES
jgi:hypothetical protein